MDRRNFLSGVGAAIGGALFLPSCSSPYQQAIAQASSVERDRLENLVDESQRGFNPRDNKLRDPRLASIHPYIHYVSPSLETADLSGIIIGVDLQTRNVVVCNDNRFSEDTMLYRAPTILGSQGRNASGTSYISSFSGPNAAWIPVENQYKPGDQRQYGVFGNLWVPLQRRNIVVDSFQGQWGPESYNMLAIHGTNNNAAFESSEVFGRTHSRGCARLYELAVEDFRRILEFASPNRFPINANFRNPNSPTYAMGRSIPVIFGRNLI